jgi:hypothetical protein
VTHPLLLEQPEPKGDGPAVWQVLFSKAWFDHEPVFPIIYDRAGQGFRRYGDWLRAHNGRNARADLAQELADAAFYATQLEMEGGPSFVEEVLGLLERVVNESGGDK